MAVLTSSWLLHVVRLKLRPVHMSKRQGPPTAQRRGQQPRGRRRRSPPAHAAEVHDAVWLVALPSCSSLSPLFRREGRRKAGFGAAPKAERPSLERTRGDPAPPPAPLHPPAMALLSSEVLLLSTSDLAAVDLPCRLLAASAENLTALF